MTNEARMTKCRIHAPSFSSFGFRHFFDIRRSCFVILRSPNQPHHETDHRSAQMRKRRDRADSRLLFPCADELKQDPEDEREPGGEGNPPKPNKTPAQ